MLAHRVQAVAQQPALPVRAHEAVLAVARPALDFAAGGVVPRVAQVHARAPARQLVRLDRALHAHVREHRLVHLFSFF